MKGIVGHRPANELERAKRHVRRQHRLHAERRQTLPKRIRERNHAVEHGRDALDALLSRSPGWKQAAKASKKKVPADA